MEVFWSICIRYRKPLSKDSEGDCMRLASTRRGRGKVYEMDEVACLLDCSLVSCTNLMEDNGVLLLFETTW